MNNDDDDDENRVAVGHRDDSRVDTTPLLGVLARHTAPLRVSLSVTRGRAKLKGGESASHAQGYTCTRCGHMQT